MYTHTYICITSGGLWHSPNRAESQTRFSRNQGAPLCAPPRTTVLTRPREIGAPCGKSWFELFVLAALPS